MPIYRKGDDLFPLRERAEQEKAAEAKLSNFEKQEAGRHLLPENVMISPWGGATNYYSTGFLKPWTKETLSGDTPVSGRAVAQGRKREKSSAEARAKFHGAGVIKAGKLVKGGNPVLKEKMGGQE